MYCLHSTYFSRTGPHIVESVTSVTASRAEPGAANSKPGPNHRKEGTLAMADHQNDPSALIVPFGKHQGLTVAELLERDPNYVQWLLSQNWLAQRFAQLHAAILTRGAAPDDSPEHNRIQARFLDPLFRTAFIDLARDLNLAQDRDCRSRAREPTAKKEGAIDTIERLNKMIAAGVENPWYQRELEDAQKRRDQYQDLIDAARQPMLVDSVVEFEQEGIDVLIRWGFEYADQYKITVEIKPSLGDDYPSVMRQMNRLGASVLVIDQYNSDTLPLNTVREMFENNGQMLITLKVILDNMPYAKKFLETKA